MKNFFTKTLTLIALAAMTGAAHAQVCYDFKKWAIDNGVTKYSDYVDFESEEFKSDFIDEETALPVNLSYIKDLVADNGAKLNLDRHFAVNTTINTEVFYFTNNKNCPGLYAYGSGQNKSYFSIVNLHKGDEVRVVYNGTILKYANTNATYYDQEGELKTISPETDWANIKPTNSDGSGIATGTAEDGTAEYGTPTLTVLEDGQIDFQLTTGSKYHGILRVYLKTVDDVVFAPTSIRATKAFFGERTITIDCPNTSSGETPTVIYSLDGSDPLNDDPLIYSEDEKPVITEATTIKAQAVNLETFVFSDITEATIEAGTTVSLAPGDFSIGKPGKIVTDSTTMETHYFSSVIINDTTQNVIGMPRVYYIINGDTLATHWNNGNIYDLTYVPLSREPFQVEFWADGYESQYLTVEGIKEFAQTPVVDFTTFTPGESFTLTTNIGEDMAEDWPEDKSRIWPETWTLPEDTKYYVPNDENAIPGVQLGSRMWILAEGIGLIPANGSAYITISPITEEEDFYAEFSMYNGSNLENISSIWRQFDTNYTYNFPGTWGMAVRAINFYKEMGESDGIEELPSNRATHSEDVYSLSGMRMQQPTKGLYIKKGKKYYIK